MRTILLFLFWGLVLNTARAQDTLTTKTQKKKYTADDLLVAAAAGDTNSVALYLKNGLDINAKTQNGQTALMEAVSTFGLKYPPPHQIEVVKFLLGKGANANSQDSSGKTVLMVASTYRRLEVVKLLLENGADINAMDHDTLTALLYVTGSLRNNRIDLDITKLLLEKGANPNIHPAIGYTALTEAAMFRRFELAKLLVEKGADVNAADSDGYTALMDAAAYGRFKLVKSLLEHGANVTVRNREEQTALSIARNWRVKRLLRSYGAKE